MLHNRTSDRRLRLWRPGWDRWVRWDYVELGAIPLIPVSVDRCGSSRHIATVIVNTMVLNDCVLMY